MKITITTHSVAQLAPIICVESENETPEELANAYIKLCDALVTKVSVENKPSIKW